MPDYMVQQFRVPLAVLPTFSRLIVQGSFRGADPHLVYLPGDTYTCGLLSGGTTLHTTRSTHKLVTGNYTFYGYSLELLSTALYWAAVYFQLKLEFFGGDRYSVTVVCNYVKGSHPHVVKFLRRQAA